VKPGGLDQVVVPIHRTLSLVSLSDGVDRAATLLASR
jgi:hypothetical protein